MTARPILVTGSHRSGTTWTGTILCASGEAFGIHEPFNPAYPRSWLRDRPPHWFEDAASDDARWADQVRQIVDLRPPWVEMARRSAHPKHLARVGQEAVASALARRRRARALIKDPIAFFSTAWFAAEFDADVVVLIRHPAAFASSLKRLDWGFDFAHLAEQGGPMSKIPARLRAEVNDAVGRKLDVIDTAILLWRVINSVTARYRADHPEWQVLRYEDLAKEPVRQFELLYGKLGLEWTTGAARSVTGLTGEGNISTVPDGDKGGVVRDSRAAMWTWKDRLSTDEIERVRAGVTDVADEFYSPSDWDKPG